MKKYFYIVLLGVVFLTSAATVQAQSIALGSSSIKLARVDDAQISTLRNLKRNSKTLVYLGASAAALQKDPAALSALQNWIKDGGVMAVYSDAAKFFGFQLQTARPGNAQKGGQLFGRAVAAPLFGSEPLLWNTSENNASAVKSSATLGGMTVFYQMQKGDPLAVSHVSAVPLLRVTDLAEPQTALLASAMTSYGNGWIIFVPRQLETTRTQGNQFLNNLLQMASDPPLPVDMSAITATANSFSEPNPDYKPLLAQLQKRLDGKGFSADATTLMPQTLAVARPLAQAMVNAINAPRSPKRLNAAIDLWLMQAELQRAKDDSPAATQTASTLLADATKVAPQSQEVLFWKGVMQAQKADDAALSPARRASDLNEAAADWISAAAAMPLLAHESTFTSAASFGNITPAMLKSWANQASHAATAITHEPSAFTLVGQGEEAVILRHDANDPTLRLAEPSIRKLQSMATDFGWIVPGEEVFIFPNQTALDSYATYNGATSFGSYGCVLQDQLLMISQPSEPIIVPGTPERIITTGAKRRIILPGIKARVVQAGTAAAAMVGRMHAQALVNVLDQDGGQIPVWMQLGMMALGGDAATGNTQSPTLELQQAGAANTLLSADRFNAGMLNQNTAGLADAEALSLMTYFYRDFGSGSVMETIQRIASGQNANEALKITTGMNENEFFAAWYNALSGSSAPAPRPVPRPAVRRRKVPKITNKSVSRAVITRF